MFTQRSWGTHMHVVGSRLWVCNWGYATYVNSNSLRQFNHISRRERGIGSGSSARDDLLVMCFNYYSCLVTMVCVMECYCSSVYNYTHPLSPTLIIVLCCIASYSLCSYFELWFFGLIFVLKLHLGALLLVFLLPSEWADQSNPVLCIWHVASLP